jgi:hypothetical protein
VEELRRKARERIARQPAQRCGVDGCEFQTKQKGNLKIHQARVHGIGDVDAEELRRKNRERQARQPDQRCGIDGCEYQTKDKGNLKQHRARVHGIGDVDADELRRKERERYRKSARQSEASDDETNPNEVDDEVATVTPRSLRPGARRSLRSRPPANLTPSPPPTPPPALDPQDLPDLGTGLCLICTLPMLDAGGTPSALQCEQCSAAYHRSCGALWTAAHRCYYCGVEGAVFGWSGSGSPERIVEPDGGWEEEEDEDEDEDEDEEEPEDEDKEDAEAEEVWDDDQARQPV